MANLQDVVAASGVSAGAVSRILSQDPTLRVSEATRQRVLDMAAKLHYVPSHAARSLRTSRADAIALILPVLTSAVVSELVSKVEEATAARGIDLMYAGAERVLKDPQWIRDLIASGRVDGVLLQLSENSGPDFALDPTWSDLPIVLVNSVDSGPIDTVVFDDAASVGTAVRHLHDLGHRRIGFVGGNEAASTTQRRRAGFLAAMGGCGVEANPAHIFVYRNTGTGGRAAARAIVASTDRPTAIAVANVDAALGVLAELHHLGMHVPHDISLVAVHDVWYADAALPPITTVQTPFSEIGPTAVDLLLSKVPGREVTHLVVTEPQPRLILRESAANPGKSDTVR